MQGFPIGTLANPPVDPGIGAFAKPLVDAGVPTTRKFPTVFPEGQGL